MNDSPKRAVLLWAVLSIPVIWLGVLLAGCCGEGVNLFEWMAAVTVAIENPFDLQINGYTKKVVLIVLVVYCFAIAMYYSERGNYRNGEEYGSAQWYPASQVNSFLSTKKSDQYVRLSQNVSLSMNTWALPKRYQLNLNVLVIGGSGAGKTRYYIIPNLLEADCSYIVTDPKGELTRMMSGFFEKKGYEINVFNLVDMKQSDCYNPMAYVKDSIQVAKLVSILMSNVTDEQAKSSDPFWEQAEKGLLSALILYLCYEAPAYEQNLAMVSYMVENMEVKEDDSNYKDSIDLLFDELAARNDSHEALKMYRNYKKAAPRTAMSILISTATRLQTFIIPDVVRITSRDDLNLTVLGERKKVIFIVASDTDSTFDYLMGMLYAQTFQELYASADLRHKGRLPIPVRLMMDEFANIVTPSEFERIMATCRSRQISVSIVLQSLAQLKGKFKDVKWEGIVGNCDSFVYLGGNDHFTHEYVSKLLGKETVDVRTRGVTRGRNGSSSANYQRIGRELMAPDEVRMLPNTKSILVLKGVYPVLDTKYDLEKHPNYADIANGGQTIPEKRSTTDICAKKDLDYEPTLENIEILEEINHEPET